MIRLIAWLILREVFLGRSGGRLTTYIATIFLILICLVASPATVIGGSIKYGVRLGASLSRFSEDSDSLDASVATAAGFAGVVSIPLSSELELQLEFNYVQHGEKRSYSTIYYGGRIDIDETVRVRYFEVPILIRMPIDTSGSTRSGILAGPFFSILQSDRRKGTYNFVATYPEGDSSFDSPIGNTKSVEFGIVFGADMIFDLLGNDMVLDLRYVRGLTDIFKDVDYDPEILKDEAPMIQIPSGKAYEYQNRTLAISIGVLF